ncbi:hypothetical protein ACFE04_022642 [Oxalis oulophora]
MNTLEFHTENDDLFLNELDTSMEVIDDNVEKHEPRETFHKLVRRRMHDEEPDTEHIVLALARPFENGKPNIDFTIEEHDIVHSVLSPSAKSSASTGKLVKSYVSMAKTTSQSNLVVMQEIDIVTSINKASSTKPLNLSVNYIQRQIYLQAAISLGESVKEALLVAPYDEVLSFSKEMTHVYAELENECVNLTNFRRYVGDLVATTNEFLQDVAYKSLLQKEHEISHVSGCPLKDDQLLGDAQQKFEECLEILKNMPGLVAKIKSSLIKNELGATNFKSSPSHSFAYSGVTAFNLTQHGRRRLCLSNSHPERLDEKIKIKSFLIKNDLGATDFKSSPSHSFPYSGVTTFSIT